MELRPSDIRFSQDSISNVFDKRSSHRSVFIGKTLDDLCNGTISINAIPRISVFERNGKCYTADNRRLWMFRELERLGMCTHILVCKTGYFPSRKFTTVNDGVSIRVRGGGPGGVWHNAPSRAPRDPSVMEKPTYQQVKRTLPHVPRPSQTLGGFGMYPAAQPHSPPSRGQDQQRLLYSFSNMSIEGRTSSLAGRSSSIAPAEPPTMRIPINQQDNRISTQSQRPSTTRNGLGVSPVSSGIRRDGQQLGNPALSNYTQRQTRPPPGIGSFAAQRSASARPYAVEEALSKKHGVTYVDPLTIRYTKTQIPATFDDGRRIRELTTSVTYGLVSARSLPALTVYKAFGMLYVLDGNRRLKAMTDVRETVDPSLKVKVIINDVDDDEGEFIDKVIEQQPSLHDFDLLRIGENIEVI